jgi:hypothetical protein
VGAVVIESLSTLISVPISIPIGQFYDEAILPLIGGFSILSILLFLTIGLTEKWKPTAI